MAESRLRKLLNYKNGLVVMEKRGMTQRAKPKVTDTLIPREQNQALMKELATHAWLDFRIAIHQ